MREKILLSSLSQNPVNVEAMFVPTSLNSPGIIFPSYQFDQSQMIESNPYTPFYPSISSANRYRQCD